MTKQELKTELNTVWNKLFKFNWVFGLVLLAAICIPRFILVLNANLSGNYGNIGIIMIVSALVPFLFLSRMGLVKIGFTRPTSIKWILYSFIIGLLISGIVYFIGIAFYSDTISNWYVYIGKSYNLPGEINAQDKFIFFLVFAGTGMIFSPIGEELFFRGIVHASFGKSLGERNATIVESLSFALTHLAHFGIVYVAGTWEFLLVPSILWVSAMFLTSLAFVQCKKKSGSILGAIVCHSGFNFSMIYFIFYHL